MREHYLDYVEKILNSYSIKRIDDYMNEIRQEGMWEHGFPRVVAASGILISKGRRNDLKEKFIEMMDLCLEQMMSRLCGNEFSVKEIIFSILELEKAGVYDTALTQKWRKILSEFDPYKVYTVIAASPPQPTSNWAAFGAASEQARKMAGINIDDNFLENQFLSQLVTFDENGMFYETGDPMFYDLVPRLQLAVALFCGYSEKGKEEFEGYLIKSAEPTLKMQSVTGEIPYGGRSIQFIHNEALYAALCEFYANFFNKRGNKELASQFKRASNIAFNSFIKWLKNDDECYHIKNRFERNSMYGCEDYGFFNAYMIATASWLYLAYMMADDNIMPCETISEKGNYIWETSDVFHKVFMNHSGYFIEIDTNAYYHYDSSGIGRIHYKDAPSTICLSVPFCENPDYKLNNKNTTSLSIAPGIENNGIWHYAWEEDTKYIVKSKNITAECMTLEIENIYKDTSKTTEIIEISQEGVKIKVIGLGNIKLTLPAFYLDGKYNTEIKSSQNSLSIHYEGWSCNYITDCKIIDTEITYQNRNGYYKRYDVIGKDELEVLISIQKEK